MRESVTQIAEPIISKINRRNWAVLALLVIGIFLRFVYLDADPYYYAWIGYVPDEGRWNEGARSLIHGGSLFTRDGNLHLLLAPLFQITNYLIYLAFDISRATSRLFPAICGSAILILFYFNLRSKVTPQALLLGTALLVSQTDLVNLSRVSTPEIIIIFFQLLVFFLVISKKYYPYNNLLAGFLMFISIGMKATVLPFVPIISVIILVLPPLSQANGSSGRWRNLLLFWIGLALPALLIGIIGFFCCISQLPAVLDIFTIIKGFINIASPFGFFSFFLELPLSTTFNIWGLGLWLALLSWFAIGREKNVIGTDNKRLLVAAIVWFVLYFLIMQSLSYFPERYKVHILIPMAIIITLGISVFQKIDVKNLTNSFLQGTIPAQRLKITLLGFPAAVLFSPLLVFLLRFVFENPEQYRYKIASIAILAVTFSLAGFIYRHNKITVYFFLAFPVIGSALWLILSNLSAAGYPFWLGGDASNEAAIWALILFVSSVVSIILAYAANRRDRVPWGKIFSTVSLFYLVIMFIKISPIYINPQYTIRDISISFEKLLANSSSVASYQAAGLFLDNSISYQWLDGRRWKIDKPEIIVKVYTFTGGQEFIDKNYHPIKRYKLFLSPEFFTYYPDNINEVVVYKRNDPGPDTPLAITRSPHEP